MPFSSLGPAHQSLALPLSPTLPPTQTPSQGIKVGEWWKDRLDCRQWGAHFPHVAGIAGQSNAGAQSVVLSGGCDARLRVVLCR